MATRDEGLIGGCYTALWINGMLAARIDVAETAAFRVTPGEYVLRVGRDPEGKSLCSMNQDNYTDREAMMHTNETKRFRLFLDPNGVFDVRRAD